MRYRRLKRNVCYKPVFIKYALRKKAMKIIQQIGSLFFVAGLFVTIFAGVPWHVMAADDPVVPWWLRIAIFCLLGGILVVMVTLALEQIKYKISEEELVVDRSR